MKKIVTLLLVLFAINATAQIKWRLISVFEYDQNNTTGNLTEYTYDVTKNHGGILRRNDQAYRKSLQNPDDPTFQSDKPGLQYSNSTEYIGTSVYVKRKQNFNQNDQVIEQITYYQSKVASIDSFFYDNNGNMTAVKTYGEYWHNGQNIFGYSGGSIYTFDNANRIIKSKNTQYYSSADSVYTTFEHDYTYDTNGDLLKDSVTLWDYDSQNAIFVNVPGDVYTYVYNNGVLKNKDTYKWPSGSISLQERTDYYYDNNSRLVKDTTYIYTGPDTNYRVMNDYTYNNNGQLQKVYSVYPPNPNFEIIRSVSYTYNNDGLLTEIRDSVLQSGTGTWHGVKEYKYEHYWPVDILPANRQGANENVYPNPASGIVNVHTNWKEAGQVNGTITDMQGRVLRRWTEHSVSTYDKHLNIHQLASGVYILHLTNNNEAISRQLIVR